MKAARVFAQTSLTDGIIVCLSHEEQPPVKSSGSLIRTQTQPELSGFV